MRILVNKSSVHFRAYFAPIAEKILITKSPGPMITDPADFPWRNLQKGLRIKPNGKPFKSKKPSDEFQTEWINENMKV